MTDIIIESINKCIHLYIDDISKSFNISKEILEMKWKNIGKTDEKIPNNTSVKKSITFETLNLKKISELKDMCKQYGIKKTGNKTQIIELILQSSLKEDEDIKTNEKDIIPHLNIIKPTFPEKRTNFENTILNSNIEEEDFDFGEEESSIENDNESINEEEEDIEEDDEDF